MNTKKDIVRSTEVRTWGANLKLAGEVQSKMEASINNGAKQESKSRTQFVN